ncbi:MAG TPA: universal stress protein [Stellaceae bacterium]|nr:universal stress protein [Stellaceae bacterium]
MKRILVADDGSEAANSAVEMAALLAAKTGAELVALAVVDPSRIRTADIADLARAEKLGDAEALETLIDASAPYLARCEAAAKRAGVTHFRGTRRASDDVALEIADFARAQDVDLIVVGSRGRSRLPGLLLGSVSQKLATYAPCSVLIAR